MIKDILDKVALEPGSNAKMDILREHSDNEQLKQVLYLANSKRIKFYIKQIPEYTNINLSVENGGYSLAQLLGDIHSLPPQCLRGACRL